MCLVLAQLSGIALLLNCAKNSTKTYYERNANKALVLTMPARGSFQHNCPP